VATLEKDQAKGKIFGNGRIRLRKRGGILIFDHVEINVEGEGKTMRRAGNLVKEKGGDDRT